ncbi:MAG: glycosyltransferase [Coriobacteriia bacterium]|nr:glycosyltransferase [Coriobacteriia bacterium]
MDADGEGRLRGLAFAKQFPSPAEPLRGLFVAEQLDATARAVSWRVIAPVPWVPRVLAGALRKPYVRGDGEHGGVEVSRPRYPVLPRRLLYAGVASSMARAARGPFARALADHAPAFVHAHALYPSAAAARRLAAAAGVPLIVTVHGSDLYTNLVRPAWKRELEEVAAYASAIVCVSDALAGDAVSLIGADPARTVVIPDTYDGEAFSFVSRDRGAPSPVRLVAVGRLVPEKGHAVLLDALAALVAEGRDLELTIVGDGPLRERLARLSQALGLVGRVRLAGPLPQEELREALGSADLFVLPSLREGFGVALIEAMSTGLPAVATRSGGPSGIVGPGQGVLVEPGDRTALAEGIRLALEDQASFDGAAIAASIRERFSKEVVGHLLVRLYREVAARSQLSGTAADRGGSGA